MSSVASLTKIGSIAVLFAVIAHFCMLNPANAQSQPILCTQSNAAYSCGGSGWCCDFSSKCVNNLCYSCNSGGNHEQLWGCGNGVNSKCCAQGQYCAVVNAVCATCSGEEVPCGQKCCPFKEKCAANGSGGPKCITAG